ncbi:hypothetical protein KSMBR1_2499 [Candidatus Kuenenia stuttgartiensis]|uniref:Uncharacterized protein n=1 Tax=Kuenenia stuttgartiensis TaxID=174633 RepID=A0A2C9CH22_KUEST|nr:hypothetical protein KSMBR1_2499 [Candidatus Kuenenia stuttgartiensis]
MTRTFPSRNLGMRMESGHLWQRLYSVVDINAETHCMRLYKNIEIPKLA